MKKNKKLQGFCIAFSCAAIAVSLAVILVCSAVVPDTKVVHVVNSTGAYDLVTAEDTVGEALALAGISLGEDESADVESSAEIDDVDNITFTKDASIADSRPILDTQNEFDNEAREEQTTETQALDVNTEGSEEETTENDDSSEETEVQEGPVTEIHHVDEIEEIDFETEYVDDDSMVKGSEKTVQKGQKGIITKVYEVTYVDGVETERKLVATKNTQEVQNEIIACGTIDATENSRGENLTFSKCITCKATAYEDNDSWGNQIYYGSQLGGLTTRWGVIAVDPDVIPLGTKVYVKSTGGTADYGYAIAADIGGGIDGNRVDLWMDSLETANTWGVRTVEVYILEDQDMSVSELFELRGDYIWRP